jgi:hypothetical protein
LERHPRLDTFKAKALSVALDQGRAKIKKARLVKYICISILVVQKCGMATLDNDDLKAIKDLIEVTVEEVIENKGLVTKDDISHLPTKDEFYGTIDKVMGELKAIREEVSVLAHQVSEHDDRIDKLESDRDASN